MPSLKDIQDQFQKAILEQDDTILEALVDTSKEKRTTLLGVYRHAYGARLTEFLMNDFPKLHLYLGDEQFGEVANGYILAHPSDTPNARWFGRHFVSFLESYAPLQHTPECLDLAALEQGLATAFDAKDMPLLNKDHLASIAPNNWPDLLFTPHPSANAIEVTTNTQEIWTALHKDETPPATMLLEAPATILIWRGDGKARYRTMNPDEAMIWVETNKGANFGQICALLGTYWSEDVAPGKAAAYLLAWLESDLLIQP